MMLKKFKQSLFGVWLKKLYLQRRITQLKKNPRAYILVTLHQAGTHWIKMLLAQVFSRHFNLGITLDDIHAKQIIPDLGSRVQSLSSPLVPVIYHTHMPYTKSFAKTKIILVVRDLRDALVSQYEKYTKVTGISMTFSEFLRKKSEDRPAGKHTLASRIMFLNSWYNQRDKMQQHIIRYEDFKAHTTSELTKLLDFIGVQEVNSNIIEKAITHASLEHMLTLQKKTSGEEKQKHTINKGITGRYKDFFSDEDKDYFLNQIKHLDYDYGYDYTQW